MKNAAKALSKPVAITAQSGLPPEKSHVRTMPGPAKPLNVLAPQIDAERQRIHAQFDAGASAKETLHALCELADTTIGEIFSELMKIHETPDGGLSLLTIDVYVCSMQFHISDIDILF